MFINVCINIICICLALSSVFATINLFFWVQDAIVERISIVKINKKRKEMHYFRESEN